VHMACDHLSLLREPHVADLAARLTDEIEQLAEPAEASHPVDGDATRARAG